VSVLAAHDLVDEAAIAGQVFEVVGTAHQPPVSEQLSPG
jgi:hypothetical protein